MVQSQFNGPHRRPRGGELVPPGGIETAIRQLDMMIENASAEIKSIPREGVERDLAQQHYDSLQLARNVLRIHLKK